VAPAAVPVSSPVINLPSQMREYYGIGNNKKSSQKRTAKTEGNKVESDK
jgi:hypothetical protein